MVVTGFFVQCIQQARYTNDFSGMVDELQTSYQTYICVSLVGLVLLPKSTRPLVNGIT